MQTVSTLISVSLSLVLLLQPAYAADTDFVDVLDLPASHSTLSSRGLMLDVTHAGERLIAVGQRGHIIYSDDKGHNWQQGNVPASSDLTAVSFPTPQQGWAVGHDGLVLHSADGGVNWIKQLDGRQIGTLMLNYYIAQASTHPGEQRYIELIDEAHRLMAEGADKPFLDVWFENSTSGYIIGAFNLIFRTDDGGRTWTPQQHLVDNPYALHLNAITQAGESLYIAGEQGLLLKKEPHNQQFVTLPSPYEGSFFGLLGDSTQLLVAYGLRGHAFLSTNEGETWTTITTGTSASLTTATRDAQGRLFLFSQDGQVLMSEDNGLNFISLASNTLPLIAGVAVERNEYLVLVGAQGVHLLTAK